MKKPKLFRHAAVLLLSFALVGTILFLGFRDNPLYVGSATAAVGILIAVQIWRVRKARARVEILADAVLRDAYSRLSTAPSLEARFSYGYPAFEVKFLSKAELEAAASMNDAFKTKIGEVFKNWGSRKRPFSARMAVFFTYDGHLAELMARAKNA